MTRRVVVTGMGVVSPLGQDAESTWSGIKAGRSGVGAITRFDPQPYLVKIAAEVKDWEPTAHMPAKEARRRDRYQQFIYAATKEALANAGLDLQVKEEERARTGVIIGSAVGGVESYFEQAELLFNTHDPRRVTPFGIPMLMVNGGSDMVSIMIGAHGPSYTPISACSTGSDCIGHAFDLIRLGRLDRVVAGAGEAPIIPIGVAAFDRVGACSRDNDNPTQASRPFDKNRSGLVFGEGAGVLVLESLEHAQARGANILAEIVGYGSTSDAYHSTAPHPESLGAILAIEQALADAKLTPQDIQYINAHGTATAINDPMETHAVKKVFGEHAYQVPMSSTKSMTGHAMGATAAIEAAFVILALRDQVAPPTMNLTEKDPDCDLDYVPNEARDVAMTHVMTNAFGFGGHNVSLIFSRFVG